MDLLRKARADLALAEDDPRARALQRLSILHVDAAIHAADRAIHAVRRFEDSPENKTFRVEGWLPIAFFLAIVAIGFIAALIVPNLAPSQRRARPT